MTDRRAPDGGGRTGPFRRIPAIPAPGATPPLLRIGYAGRIVLSAALIAAYFLFWQVLPAAAPEAPSFSLRMTVRAATPQVAKLYVNLGEGFSENHTAQWGLKGDGRFETCLFAISRRPVHGFRFDPVGHAGTLSIASADIVMHVAGDFVLPVRRIPLKALRPAHQIGAFSLRDGVLTLAPAQNADDPQVFIPGTASFDAWYLSETALQCLHILLIAAGVGLTGILLLRIWRQWDDPLAGAVALLALTVFALRCGAVVAGAATPCLHIPVQSSTPGILTLYCDTGRGFTEHDARHAFAGPPPDIGTCRIEIPNRPILHLRIDPPEAAETFRIGRIGIADGRDCSLPPYRVDPAHASANRDIASLHVEGESIVARMQRGAADPQIVIPFPAPLFVERRPFAAAVRLAGEMLVLTAAACAALWLCAGRTPGRFRWLLLFAAAGILFLRHPGILLDPRFLAEEGSLFFRRAWHAGDVGLSTFLYNHEIVGYYNFVADFAAWTATFPPLVHAPYATLCLSFLVQFLPVALIATSRHPLWETPLKKALGCLLVLLVPVSSEVWLTTIASQYHLGLAGFLILLESGEALTARRKWLFRALLLVGGVTGVSACLLTPLFLLKGICRRHRETLLQAAILSLATFLQLHSLGNSPNPRLANPGGVLSLAANLVNANFISTLFGPPAGHHAAQIIYGLLDRGDAALPFLLAGLLAMEGVFLYGIWRRTRNPLLFVLTAGAVLLTAGIAYVGMLASKWQTVDPFNAPRYFWLSNVLLSLCLLFALREKPAVSRTIRANLWVAFCLLAILVHGATIYDMAAHASRMPSWKKEVALWRLEGGRQPLALWPRGWYVRLEGNPARP